MDSLHADTLATFSGILRSAVAAVTGWSLYMWLMLLVAVLGLVVAICGIRKARRASIKLTAKYRAHRVIWTDSGGTLEIKLEVEIEHTGGPPTGVKRVLWNGVSGTCRNRDWGSECPIEAGPPQPFFLAFSIPILGNPEQYETTLSSRVTVICTRGTKASVDVTSTQWRRDDRRTRR